MSYVNLHAHSCYSIRDGLSKLDEIVSRSKALGMAAACITEHGFMGSAYKFYKECKKQDIKPIIGMEAYYTDGSDEKGSNYHLLLLAKNNNGYKNLCRLTTDAYINNFYRKPRVTFESLERYKDDIIVSTACLAGYPQQMILQKNYDACDIELARFHKLFGEDFYLEVHNHGIIQDGVDIEGLVRDHFREYSKKHGIKCIYGNDSHYTLESDKQIHNTFKQIAYSSAGKSSDDAFDGNGYWILSKEEALARFSQEEVDNTLEIANKCNIEFKFTGYYLPTFDISHQEKDTHEFLKDMCYAELKVKGFDTNQIYIDRLEYELNMLHMADLENYLLIVSDYCNWAKTHDVPVGPGRGSMGGSIVSWLTNITAVDPIKYDLLFARAINPGRSLQYDFGV